MESIVLVVVQALEKNHVIPKLETKSLNPHTTKSKNIEISRWSHGKKNNNNVR